MNFKCLIVILIKIPFKLPKITIKIILSNKTVDCNLSLIFLSNKQLLKSRMNKMKVFKHEIKANLIN